MPRLFADATALLEDLHGIVVDGQARDQPAEVHRVHVSEVRAGIIRLEAIASAIAARLDLDRS